MNSDIKSRISNANALQEQMDSLYRAMEVELEAVMEAAKDMTDAEVADLISRVRSSVHCAFLADMLRQRKIEGINDEN